MGMTKALFRPGKGKVIEGYTTAVAQEAIYPNEWVQFAIDDPETAQGVTAGQFEGESLGAYDYIECEFLNTGNVGCGVLALGVSMGAGIDAVSNIADTSGDVAADGDVIIIQRYGVHPRTSQVAGGTAGDYLIASGTDGEADNVLTAAAGTTGVTNILGALLEDVGETYTGAASNDGAASFIKC